MAHYPVGISQVGAIEIGNPLEIERERAWDMDFTENWEWWKTLPQEIQMFDAYVDESMWIEPRAL